MRKRILMTGLILAVTFISGCDNWEENVVVNGIKFAKFSHSSMKGYLAEDTLIQGYPCKEGFVFFYEDSRLKIFRFSKDFEFSDFVIPAKSWVKLDKDGHIHIIYFSEDTKVQGYPCRGSIMGLEGIQTSFYKNGKLNYFFPDEDVEIDGIPCKGSVFHLTQLYDNGKLRRCTLAKTTTINGEMYQKGTKIKLDKEGFLNKK
ncbi:MAG: hypothetical protein K8R02_04105 [Anaerohalosphaeraceae bacterium]|nr:hypothetical protein [Anaerohalosphaeraceae bacterium]